MFVSCLAFRVRVAGDLNYKISFIVGVLSGLTARALLKLIVRVGVGKLFRTTDRFQPGILLQTDPQLNDECLTHANLLQLVRRQ